MVQPWVAKEVMGMAWVAKAVMEMAWVAKAGMEMPWVAKEVTEMAWVAKAVMEMPWVAKGAGASSREESLACRRAKLCHLSRRAKVEMALPSAAARI